MAQGKGGTPMVRHLKDGEGFFDGGSAAMHKGFGFTGSMAKCKGGRAGYEGGGEVRGQENSAPASSRFETTPSRLPPAGNDYSDETRSRRGNASPPPMPAKAAASKPAARASAPSPSRASAPASASRASPPTDDRADRAATNVDYPDVGFQAGKSLPSIKRPAYSADTAGTANTDYSDLNFRKGGKVHDDAAQDRALISKMLKQHEKTEPVGKARGGALSRLPAGMKAPILRRHSPIETAPRNPTKTVSPRNDMAGGQMPYGVEPSAEPFNAGSTQGIPQLRRGGRMKGC